MKLTILAFCLTMFLLLIAGCVGQPDAAPTAFDLPTSTAVKQNNPTLSPTPNELATAAMAYDLTATTRAKTPTSTPTSTPTQTQTPSITPTFDYSHFVTRTPAPAARCPVFNQTAAPTPAFGDSSQWAVKAEDIKDYLNIYGPKALIEYYQHNLGKYYKERIQGYADYTGDNVREIAIVSGNLYIFGCNDGQYELLFRTKRNSGLRPSDIIQVVDANRNGIPEITIRPNTWSQGGHVYSVIEWDGTQFQELLSEVWAEATGSFGVDDINRDGYAEYVLNVGITYWETYRYGIPWRQEKDYFLWNGQEYTLFKQVFSPPEYRFQAIQDGERALVAGELDQALDFYRQAIYDPRLGWWTPERAKYVMDKFLAEVFDDPLPVLPQPDPVENNAIAAYARFKIMLIYISRGWLSDAKFLYDHIQRDYPPENAAHPYAQLAESFWTEYSSSGDSAQSCLAAIQFAQSNRDKVLIYIGGGDYFGSTTNIDYRRHPEFICPFR